MSYRDDLAAAASRAEAAEKDLARARADDTADKERIDALARELAASRRELAHLKERLAELDPSPATPEVVPVARVAPAAKSHADAWAIVLPTVIGLGIIVGFVFLLARGPGPSRALTCEVTSIPTGAAIYRVYDSQGDKLGVTPLTLKAEDWMMIGVHAESPRFEARLAGYQTTPIVPPLGGRCDRPLLVTLAPARSK